MVRGRRGWPTHAVRLSASALLLVVIAALLPFAAPPARADIVDLPSAPADGCLASVAGAVGLFDGVQSPAGGISLDVPGPVIQVIVEWIGRDDAAAGVSDLGVAVDGPSGPSSDPAVPGTLGSSDNTRIDGTGDTVYAWWADITDMFGDGDPGAYEVDITPFATPGVGESLGAAVTVVYDTSPCTEVSRVIWKIGADYYFGGNNSSSKTTDLIVYDFDEPLADDLVTTVRAAHGGADHTAGRCRVSIIWAVSGTGSPPAKTDDLVDQSGNVAYPGAVEVVKRPFTPPSQPCAAPSLAAPVVGFDGGNVGPQYALVELDVSLPAGTDWVAFQIESPEDNDGLVGIPESGAWGGAGILIYPVASVAPAVEIEKTVLAGHGASCPGTEGTDELVTGLVGAPVTYCFRVVNTGTTPLFPVAIDDPDLGITHDDMTLVTGDATVPLLPGDDLVYAYETTIEGDLVNVATVTGTASEPDGDPLPDVDPVTDSNDAAVDAEAPGIGLEKTVIVDHGVACPGVQGTDELVTDIAGIPVTYCFRVENTGDVPLFPVTVDDPDLGIGNADMTLVSGDDTLPLPPGGVLVYAYESEIDGDLTNVATATGIPSDAGGDPLPDGDPVTDDDDAAVEQLEPLITLEKTVLSGSDAACPGIEGTDEMVVGAVGAPVTFCFRLVNEGEVDLFPINLDDPTLGIGIDDLTLVSGDPTVPMAPGDEIVFSYATTIATDVLNVAFVDGIPVPVNDLTTPADLDPVSSTNDAAVQILVPDVELEKTVLAGHDAACPGEEGEDELVIGDLGDPITYCFRVVNSGNAPLFPITIDDAILDITEEDMEVVSGDPAVPLAPGEDLVFAYETTITGPMVNVAVVTGTPSDPEGDPLEPITTVTDDNDARVNIDIDADPGQDDDDDPTLPRTGTSTTDQVLFGLGLLSLGGATLMFNRLSDRRRRSQAELGGGSTANPV